MHAGASGPIAVETIGIPLLSETMDRLLGATSSEQEVTADNKTTTAATVARCHLESLMQYSLDPLAQFASDNVSAVYEHPRGDRQVTEGGSTARPELPFS